MKSLRIMKYLRITDKKKFKFGKTATLTIYRDGKEIIVDEDFFNIFGEYLLLNNNSKAFIIR